MSTSTDLARLLGMRRLTHVVDIGANPIDGTPPYRPLLDAQLCRLTGFEPQASALAELNLKKGANEAYFPYAVGDGKEHTLNLCAYSGWTSMFVPSAAALEVFSFFKNNARVVGQTRIQTHRLDDLSEVTDIDFLKMDIQGGELGVLMHGREKLKNAAAIQVELQFVNLYEGSPCLCRAQEVADFSPAARRRPDPTAQSGARGRSGLCLRLCSPRRHLRRSAEAPLLDRAFLLRQLRSRGPVHCRAGAAKSDPHGSPPGLYRYPAECELSAEARRHCRA